MGVIFHGKSVVIGNFNECFRYVSFAERQRRNNGNIHELIIKCAKVSCQELLFYTFGIVNRSKNDIFIERGIDFAVFLWYKTVVKSQFGENYGNTIQLRQRKFELLSG